MYCRALYFYFIFVLSGLQTRQVAACQLLVVAIPVQLSKYNLVKNDNKRNNFETLYFITTHYGNIYYTFCIFVTL